MKEHPDEAAKKSREAAVRNEEIVKENAGEIVEEKQKKNRVRTLSRIRKKRKTKRSRI